MSLPDSLIIAMPDGPLPDDKRKYHLLKDSTEDNIDLKTNLFYSWNQRNLHVLCVLS